MSKLQVRLRNCIQTILELEPVIQANNGLLFEEEFISLKKYLAYIENMELIEDDVLKMEKATSEFLEDIRDLHFCKPFTKQVLQ